MKYIQPKGKILSAEVSNEASQLVVEFDRMDTGPIAPAGLYLEPNSGNEIFQLHRVIEADGLVFTFQTFTRTHVLPTVGDVLFYRGWWLPKAMDAALDTEESWIKKRYPDNGYGWITREAFEQFIAGDVYRLREEKSLSV